MNGAVNAVQVVGYGGQVAAGELRTQRTGVKKRGGGAHVVEGAQQVIEFDRARGFILFTHGQAHGNAHEENLWQLDTYFIAVNKVAVVEGLQTEVLELVVALGLDGSAQSGHVVVAQLGRQQLQLDAFFNVNRQCLGVVNSHVVLGGAVCHTEEAQRFGAEFVQ